MRSNIMTITLLVIFIMSGCTDKEKKDAVTESGMKCGPGKCGASMIDGSAVLVKKKMNILKQLAEDDTRRECVLRSGSTKELYDCVRVEETGRLSTKCSADNTKHATKKEIPSMKCAPGKCGSDM